MIALQPIDSDALDSQQWKVYNLLNRLVSPGAASFFKDACIIMGNPSLLESSSHIVAHLLRETESSLKSVLLGVSETEQVLESKKCPACNKDIELNHKAQLKRILKILEIDESDPIANLWIKVFADEHRWNIYTHRKNLEGPRLIDDDFIQRFQEFQGLLLSILDKYQAHYSILEKKINEFSNISKPTRKDLTEFRNKVPNTQVSYSKFFNNLSNPIWLPLLKEAGFFKSPPPPIKIDGNSISFPQWPILEYLFKMVVINPKLVTETILEIPETDNELIQARLFEIILALPVSQQIIIKEKVIEILVKEKSSSFYSTKGAQYIKMLALNGYFKEALSVMRVYLEWIPLDGASEFPYNEPAIRIDSWNYQDFLEKDMLEISNVNPKEIIMLLSSLVNQFYEMKYPNKRTNYEDFSHMGRNVDAVKSEYVGGGVDDILVNALILVCKDNLDKKLISLKELIVELNRYKWKIFRRIEMYLLSKEVENNKQLVAKYLTNKAFFIDEKPEYKLLLSVGFNVLNKNNRNKILGYIKEASNYSKYCADLKKKDPAVDEVLIIQQWQKSMLVIIEKYLDKNWRKKYKVISDKVEPPSPSSEPSSNILYRPTSEYNSMQIIEMKDKEIVALLKSWQPNNIQNLLGPSKEGLSRVFSAAVKIDKVRFSNMANMFIEIDSIYIDSLFYNFMEGIKENVKLNWNNILTLTEWIIEQRDNEYDKTALAKLFKTGIANNCPPIKLKNRIWNVLSELSNDQNPRTLDEDKFDGNSHMLAINSTRPEAISAIIEFSLWEYRLLNEKNKPNKKNKFRINPRIKKILEYHLDTSKDGSYAVRSVYGTYFPYLLMMDKEWMIGQLPKIFGKGQFQDPFYQSAWTSYLYYNKVYGDCFEILGSQYLEASVNTVLSVIDEKKYLQRDQRLVEHYIIAYCNGYLSLDDLNFYKFWAVISPKLKQFMVAYIGRTIQGQMIDALLVGRLKSLWIFILSELEKDEKRDSDIIVGGFGWWFVSGKFEKEWAIKVLERSSNINPKIEALHKVFDSLAIYASEFPKETLRILKNILLGDEGSWKVATYKTDAIKQILSCVLESSTPSLTKEVKELINRLKSYGIDNYDSLLKAA